MLLTRIEQEDGHLAQAEVDEVFGFPCHITTEVPPHDAVPGGVVLLVELLDTGCSVLLYMIFLQCLSSTLHRVLLRLLWHIGILDLSLSVTHGYQGAGAGRLQRSPRGGARDAHAHIERQSLPKLWHISKTRAASLFFYFIILYWFCHALTWIHHGCTCVPKLEPPSTSLPITSL